jgi:hypothetical protein
MVCENTGPATPNSEPGKQSSVQPAWPEPPAPEGYYGLAGDVVRAIEPHTEADPVAVLVQTLTFFGNVVGPGPHFRVESDYHRTNLDVVLVGATSKSRKGTSKGRVVHMFETADPQWLTNRVMGGLSSGEGLIWACRDKIEKRVAIREKGHITGYEVEEIDPGVSDKRLSCDEPEFARVLKMASREGNILSEVIRQAWDTGNLRSMTKNSPATATGAHISISGHITRDELLRCLSETEQGNGFCNRIAWVCVRRSKYLPDDEDRQLDPGVIGKLQERMKSAVEFARKVGEIRRDEQARLAWRAVYKKLSDAKPGLMGAMLGRSEAQVVRLSMIYALLDKSEVIRLAHLKAALALWQYCEASTRYIFGDRLGDQTADTILEALRNSPAGLTRTDISALFGRHKPTQEVARGLGVLAGLGLATFVREETEGRSTERWTAQ